MCENLKRLDVVRECLLMKLDGSLFEKYRMPITMKFYIVQIMNQTAKRFFTRLLTHQKHNPRGLSRSSKSPITQKPFLENDSTIPRDSLGYKLSCFGSDGVFLHTTQFSFWIPIFASILARVKYRVFLFQNYCAVLQRQGIFSLLLLALYFFLAQMFHTTAGHCSSLRLRYSNI
jgi:hypothetical protein